MYCSREGKGAVEEEDATCFPQGLEFSRVVWWLLSATSAVETAVHSRFKARRALAQIPAKTFPCEVWTFSLYVRRLTAWKGLIN